MAHPEVTQYAVCGPDRSMITPASGVAVAMPTANPELAQAIDSVSRPDGTIRSMSDMPEIKTGEQAMPATNNPIPTSHTCPRNGSGSVTTASTATAIRNCRTSEARIGSAPKIKPAVSDPTAYSASSRPAAPGTPAALVNATVVTSNEPKIPPSRTKIAAMPPTPGSRIAGRPLGPLFRPVGRGSVDRWVISSSVPMTSRMVARMRPALGDTCSATTVTSGGPRMNTASSTSDSQAKAVRSSEVPCSCADHLARTNGPMLGTEAPPATANRKMGQLASVVSATATMPTTAGTWTASCSGTTRCCPKTSIARDICGPMTAADNAKIADTTPATA